MSFCPYCGNPLTEGAKFCTGCGAAVAARQEATYQEPVQQETVYQEPVTAYQEPVAPVATEIVVPTKTKVLGFVGMGLAIFGLFFAVLGTILALAGIEEEGLGFGMAFAYSMFSVPASIVGKILSEKSLNEGFCATPCHVGSKLGLFGIIASGVMLTLGLLSLIA